MASTDPTITFYDIASAEPLRTHAPNPWKTRLALNYKGVPYKTQWVDMPDIHSLRKKLGVPANRTLPDGTPYHTLPVIQDHTTGKLLGDSFEITLYLDSQYPDAPSLSRPMTIGLTAAFNQHVDGLFTKYAILCTAMPFDPRIQDKIAAMFAARAQAMGMADLSLTPEQREAKFLEFQADLGELAKAFRHTGGTTDYFWRKGGTDEKQSQRAPEGRQNAFAAGDGAKVCWLDGEEPSYSDFVVGAWLKMCEASMPKEDWERVRSWQGGVWGRFVDALEPWAGIK